MKTFYFTGTGNSLYVAKQIGGELYSIPQMLKSNNLEFEDDAIGFIFPCYVMGLPRIVEEFINKSIFKAKYFFAVITCGNSSFASFKQLEKLGKKNGINFNYTNEIIMVDNYLPLFEIQAQLKKESNKYIESNLKTITNEIKSREEKLFKMDLGANIVTNLGHNSLTTKFIFDNVDKNYVINDKCTACKICEKVCPVNNIQVDKKPKFLHKCESCMSCIHNCPQNAIHVKFERSSARFINQNIKLNEIIEANN